ncbi:MULTISPECIES: Ldh family oxidoreductase [unclassified Caballeronia]|uniref:Ldh family oxidoreductase n=1 Tax=unclassified Caballeronia TaxID=2646786 RepID=UPI002859648F|nr:MULTISPECIES: Ldh family oxidoreductase [unclassified Caballeronia]MDR5773138.1 Ldh family oxidoreductase [Caballeronia sp. LZ002]MDR5848572.1 Ldh family oxidoreductase [Caballeronia sp. LZ003]
MSMRTTRYDANALFEYAMEVLCRAGLASAHARDVARTLVDGDLMGHDTHGLALLPGYVKQLEQGAMTRDGAPAVISDRPAALLWDGRRLPGPALVHAGIDVLAPRARELGAATLVIRRSHHIACLAAYLLRATEMNLVMMLASSDPSVQSVAPFGGTRALFTPNPIALGIPTSTTPMLIDISSSVTTNAMSARRHQNGQSFDEPWMMDAQGNATHDPGVLFADPPGSILPLGGLAAGHKGFGMALMIEALTGGLAGFGRADPHEGWGATVFMSLHDPAAFGGIEAFQRQMDWLGDACRTNPPRTINDPVRLPGERAMARRAEQLKNGVHLHADLDTPLKACGERYEVRFPQPIPEAA